MRSLLLALSAICYLTVDAMRWESLRKIPHVDLPFTEGLAFDRGRLFESIGGYGSSALREIDPNTGQVLAQVALPAYYFGEGLAVINGQAFQLTWHNRKVLTWKSSPLQLLAERAIECEGWGLCGNHTAVWSTHGGSTIFERDPQTFRVTHTITVQGKVPVPIRLNDLEVVDQFVYTYLWPSEWLVQVDKEHGHIVDIVSLSSLLTDYERSLLSAEDVPNGIAYNPVSKTFFITGKRWPWIFEGRFLPETTSHCH